MPLKFKKYVPTSLLFINPYWEQSLCKKYLHATAVNSKHTVYAQKIRRDSELKCSGVGTGLQRIDSELAIEVVEQCKQQGIVALPIHDSFIVADVNKRKLQKIMTAVYTKYTGGFSCSVAEKAS